MATMNIDIAGVPIKLIDNIKTTTNSCYTITEFTIRSVPGNSITINLVRPQTIEDYDYAELKNGGGWKQFKNSITFTINSSGVAYFKLIIGNVSLAAIKQRDEQGNYYFADTNTSACNITEVTVIDNTEDETEFRSFRRCRDGDRCLNQYDPKPELTIDNDTNVRIYFDSSGSMDDTLAPLQEMRDTILKDALLPYYNNDEALYNSKVEVISQANERTLDMLNINGASPSGKIISLVFQDEANSKSNYNQAYTGDTGWTINSTRSTLFDSDLATLRSRLNAYPQDHYRGVIFQVATPATNGIEIFEDFKALIKALEYGSGSYGGTNGLSDRNEFNYKYNITPASTAQYYKDLIITALEELGFTI
jgi:hypothetical protein